MPVSFRILPDLGSVYVRYDGHVHMQEGLEAFLRYTRDPAYRPGQKQFVDLSGVTGIAPDYAAMMRVQALKAEFFVLPGIQMLLVYYAPTEVARNLAAFALRGWPDTHNIVLRMMDDEAEALRFLGLPVGSIKDLLSHA